jgi:hypothetical protein
MSRQPLMWFAGGVGEPVINLSLGERMLLTRREAIAGIGTKRRPWPK